LAEEEAEEEINLNELSNYQISHATLFPLFPSICWQSPFTFTGTYYETNVSSVCTGQYLSHGHLHAQLPDRIASLFMQCFCNHTWC